MVAQHVEVAPPSPPPFVSLPAAASALQFSTHPFLIGALCLALLSILIVGSVSVSRQDDARTNIFAFTYNCCLQVFASFDLLGNNFLQFLARLLSTLRYGAAVCCGSSRRRRMRGSSRRRCKKTGSNHLAVIPRIHPCDRTILALHVSSGCNCKYSCLSLGYVDATFFNSFSNFFFPFYFSCLIYLSFLRVMCLDFRSPLRSQAHPEQGSLIAPSVGPAPGGASARHHRTMGRAV